MTSLVANPRFDFQAPLPSLEDLGRVHFIGVGGSGMSGIARVFATAGVPVSGCDAHAGDAVADLRATGLPVAVGHDPAHVRDCDTVVVSSAIPESNGELAAARAAGRRIVHRAQALAVSMGERTRVAVAGANGKTTTSAMIASVLIDTGRDPSYAIGSPLVATGVSSALGSGDDYVVEADESDSSFLCYRPDVAVVTNVQPDHLDFYGDLAHVEAAYAAFADSVRGPGLLVVDGDDPGAARLAARARAGGRRVATYGEAAEADVRIDGLAVDGPRAGARLTMEGARFPLVLGAPGRHNVHNAAAAVAACCIGLGLDAEHAIAALAGFRGTRRRFEVRGVVGGVTVVDDYAHNAPKVAALLSGARAVASDGAMRVIFQPHLFSRTRDFAADFAAGLARADQVVLLPVYGAREQPIPGVGSHLIAEHLARLGRAADLVDDGDQAVARVIADAQPGDLVLTVGAGDVTRLGQRILDELARSQR